MSVKTILAAIFVLAVGSSPVAFAAPPTDDACSLLTPAQVGAGERLVPTSPKICGWSMPGDTNHTGKRAVLTITTVQSFNNGKVPFKGITKEPVSGIGDDALYITTPGFGIGLNVLKGGSAFQIRAYGEKLPVDQIKAIEKTLALAALAKL